MRRRMLSMLLAMCLMVALTACGGTSSTDSNKISSAATSQTSSSGIVSLSPTSTPEPTPEPAATPEPTPEPVSIAETVAYEDDTLQILLQDFTLDGDGKMNVTTCARNLTSDTEYEVELTDVYVNGVEYGFYDLDESDEWEFMETKAGEEASIQWELFEIFDIRNIKNNVQDVIGRLSDVEFCFSIRTVESWGTSDTIYEEAHIYPYGENEATIYKREHQPDDVLIAENENYVITQIHNDMFYTPGESVLFIENKSDQYLGFYFTNVVADGTVLNEYGGGCGLSPGKTSFCDVYFGYENEEKVKNSEGFSADLKIITLREAENTTLFEGTIPLVFFDWE